MKKILSMIVFSLLVVMTITGCASTKSYTYSVQTGDKVKIELNTSNGHDITSNLPFTISKDDKTLSQGTFITIDGYNQYVNAVNNDSKASIIENGSKDGITYIFYSYNDSEFNYIIKIDGSNTGILLGNSNSKQEAKDCFNRLSISLVK